MSSLYKQLVVLTETGDTGDRLILGLPYGAGGAIGSTSLDTYSDPGIGNFEYPKTAASTGNISVPPPEDYDNSPKPQSKEDFDSDINSIKDVVTPDEILMGMQYVLKRMVFKRKDTAKQVVVKCLKKDPKYFSKLKMLNVDDDDSPEIEDMMNELHIPFHKKQKSEIFNILHNLESKKLKRYQYTSGK
jgi:hypothetical protein